MGVLMYAEGLLRTSDATSILFGHGQEEVVTMNELLARIPDLEREADSYERKARALRQIVDGVRALNGDAETVLAPKFLEQNGTLFVARPRDERGPRGRQAVRRVMAEQPDRVWKVIDVKREVLRRGWSPSPKAVEAMVRALYEAGEIELVKYGHYKLARQVAEEAAPLTNLHSREGDGA